MSSENPRFKLTYFNARGLAEPIRMMFAYRGINFEDNRIPIGETFDMDRYHEIKRQYPNLPQLEIDGVTYYQTFAIVNYLAKKYGLAGTTEHEQLLIEECSEHFRTYFTKWAPFFSTALTPEQKQRLKQKLLTVDTPAIFGCYSEILTKNNDAGSPWIIGTQMSFVDICISHFVQNFKTNQISVDIVEGFPAFQKLQDRVFSQPGIQEWVVKRPNSDF